MVKIPALQTHQPERLCRDLGQRLRAHRLSRSWTQAELAERSGVSLSTLKLIESRGKGSLQRVAKIAVVLGLGADLQRLFAAPETFDSIDAIERSSQQRAPRRGKS